MYVRLPRSLLLVGTMLSAGMVPTSFACAQEAGSSGRLSTIEKQIESLQAELRHVKQEMAARDRQARAAQSEAAHAQSQAVRNGVAQGEPIMPNIPPGYALVPASPGSTPGSVVLAKAEPPRKKLKMGQFEVGPVTVTLGGYLDATGIYRSRNEVADAASSFNGIPLRSSPLYHEPEFRGTARTSRINILAEGKPDDASTIYGFAESDFEGGSPTANSVGTNSYTPRLRHAFADYRNNDWGFEVLGGQTWSLLTMFKNGLVTRTGENIPNTIDQQYLPGFTYARVPQIRFIKDFDKKFWFAVSAESPQVSYYTGPNGNAPASYGTVNITNPGTGTLASTVNYSDDIAPDIVAKAAAELGPVHIEGYGVGRVLHDRISQIGTGQSYTTFAGGGGGAILVHVIPKIIDIQGSTLVGQGIGRYGAGGLPDAVVGSNGSPAALPELQALVGITAHPDPTIDLFGYLGTEQIEKKSFDADVKGKETAFGYGNPLYSNAGCNIENSSAITPTPLACVGNTKGLVGGTVGGYWKFLKGSFGTMQTGIQYSYTHRSIFQGLGPTPKTDDNIVMLSFRYYPFQ